MKNRIIFLILVLVSALVLASCASSNPSPGTSTTTTSSQGTTSETAQSHTVSINNFAFNPDTLTVPVGTTVIWTNDDSATHKIKSATFNSGDLATGDTFEFKFDTKGKFDYSCSIHPTMTGTINVE